MIPLVIVPVITQNYVHYISRCLRSLLSQKIDRSLYEIIVFNDVSIRSLSSCDKKSLSKLYKDIYKFIILT
jgi:cellulose synthase/poly-beta-1,6-N-acetylglucosamine synthase-like glycosyltransferase